VELQRDSDRIGKQGLGLAAISYDSAAILKNFADRQHITFPLLSDPDSKIIRSFGILNDTVAPGTFTYGIPYPGTFIVDPKGVVVSKYFEDDFRERVSSSDILVRAYGQSAGSSTGVVDNKHLRIQSSASTLVALPGHRISLILDIDLKPSMHVYAPGVQGYIPIEWSLESGPIGRTHPFEYPASKMLHLEVIKETVPVYREHFRIERELTFGPENQLKTLLSATGELVLKGAFKYQACDDRECYIPATIPLEWHFKFEGLDRERAPKELQRKVEAK
jgi:hypothetical protein